MIKAVLFDLDGTLANSIVDLANAVNYSLKLKGYPTHDTETYKKFVGDGIRKTIERALPKESRSAKIIEGRRKVFREYYSVHYADNTVAYNGVYELLTELKTAKILIAVVTNKSQDMADTLIRKLYGDIFDGIFGSIDGVPPKPNPKVALTAMEKLNVKPFECAFLGDSGVDILTAVNSGALPIGELWGYRDEKELLENGAKYIIKNPSELLKIIAKEI